MDESLRRASSSARDDLLRGRGTDLFGDDAGLNDIAPRLSIENSLRTFESSNPHVAVLKLRNGDAGGLLRRGSFEEVVERISP